MKRKFAAAVCLVVWIGLSTAHAGEPESASRIHWHHDFYAAHRVAVSEGKPMLLVFGAIWCGPCRTLKKQTLQDPQLADYVNRAYVPVYLDFDSHTKLAQILEVNRVPSTLMLTPSADLLGRHVGFADSKLYTRWLSDAELLRMQVMHAHSQRSTRRR